jgi:hypothetical protein
MTKKISKKTILHDEVQTKISKMLYNQHILYKNNPINNTETNARLIKSFLYKQISNKYPKYNSFDKISTINKLNDNELSNLLEELPNLDEYYTNIQQSKEKRTKENKDKLVNNSENIKEHDSQIISSPNETVSTESSESDKSDKSTENIETDNFTKDDNEELNNNFNLTDKIITIVRNFVIVYTFYKIYKWFV